MHGYGQPFNTSILALDSYEFLSLLFGKDAEVKEVDGKWVRSLLCPSKPLLCPSKPWGDRRLYSWELDHSHPHSRDGSAKFA
jgi:hypothetical protein